MSKFYKACRNSIVTLKPLIDTINNELKEDIADPLHAKFRCDKIHVISIINVKTNEEMNQDKSIYDESFIYKTGEIVSCNNFDNNINIVCGKGIHYFKTEEAALSWFYQNTSYSFQNGKMTCWHDNGNKKYEVSYKDGKRDGTWTWWYKNGNKEWKERWNMDMVV